MRFHRGRVYFVRWDQNPACESRDAASGLPGARRINEIWYTPVLPYRSGETETDMEVICKCNAFVEGSKHPVQSRNLIPADLLYDVALGRTPRFFDPVAEATDSVR